MALTLGNLIAGQAGLSLRGNPEITINKITSDSRQADSQTLFVAVRGSSGDGHRYLDQVAANGCQAVVVEEDPGPDFAAVVTAANTRRLPALLARRLHDSPDLVLLTAAVTGTNGKTTVSYLLRQMLNRLQGPCGLLGTISYDDGQRSVVAPLTTPGGTVFYQWLAAMRDNKCRSVALEISSHALDQGRTAGLGLDVAIMTNLGRDHLDYHRNLAEYLQAKAKILDLLRPDGEGPLGRSGVLVINADDEHLVSLDTAGRKKILFSARLDSDAAADLKVESVKINLSGTSLTLRWCGESWPLASQLVGRYNVENLVAAMAAGLALGFEPAACAQALAQVDQVPGRMERIALPSGAIAVVDYAHTHDALSAVLTACDELVENQLFVVFGCGGDRDRGKRPLMGQVAARQSDRVWITSDNPRSEDPSLICQEILAGYQGQTPGRSQDCQVVVDRRLGIEAALSQAERGDIVVIAGKGHEDYQIIGQQRLDLDDRQIVSSWVKGQAADD